MNPGETTWLRLRLAKEGDARFLGHLDLMRALERAIRRAGLPLAYTGGFNPQPRLVAASALALGASSEAELFDVGLSHPVDPGEGAALLAGQLPRGLRLLAARAVGEARPSLAEALAWAAYRLRLDGVPGGGWSRLLESAAAEMGAATRGEAVAGRGETAAGPRGGRPAAGTVAGRVREITLLRAREGEALLHTVLAAGARGHLRPAELVAWLEGRGGAGLRLLEVHRLELFAERDGKPVPLWES